MAGTLFLPTMTMHMWREAAHSEDSKVCVPNPSLQGSRFLLSFSKPWKGQHMHACSLKGQLLSMAQKWFGEECKAHLKGVCLLHGWRKGEETDTQSKPSHYAGIGCAVVLSHWRWPSGRIAWKEKRRQAAKISSCKARSLEPRPPMATHTF